MSIVKIKTGGANAGTPETIGAKAAILARVAGFGLPVPPAFVLPIELGAAMMQGDKEAERAFAKGLEEGIAFLERGNRPALRPSPQSLARLGALGRRALDAGHARYRARCRLHEEATRGLIRMTGNPRFAFDCRRRFLEAYAETVLGLDPAPFRAKRGELIAEASAASDRDLDSEALERLSFLYEDLIDRAGEDALRRSDGAAQKRRARRLSLLPERPLPDLSPPSGARGSEGKCGHGAGHGVRKSAGPIRLWRRLLARPLDRGAVPVIDVLFEAQGEDVVSGRGRPLTEEDLANAAPKIAAELHAYLGA